MSRCPVDHGKGEAPVAAPHAMPEQKSSPSGAKCPVDHSARGAAASELNPLNNIPRQLNHSHGGDDEAAHLPSERVVSNIPNASEAESHWVYPSPRQFYNALRRKGWETPQNEVQVMVDIHNSLNETAWQDILKWESLHKDECAMPKLLKLRGRPDDISPKARFHMWWHGTPRPFDRHDWVIDRCGREVRYVIDYYSGANEDNGETPVFFMDVRPALDSPQSVFDRINMFWQNRAGQP
ncbi:holocytochrome c synthase [Sorochytrium milnesiophthora]